MPDRSGRAQRLEALWYAPVAPPLGLRLLACVYGLVLGARRGLFSIGLLRAFRAPVPVVVVGNVTVGGTGKTPLTAWLAQQLAAAGRRPGIASRGYGRTTRGTVMVEPGAVAAEVGDEPLLLRRETGVPVCVAARRIDAARALAAAGCDLVLCDDGLQHLALARDLELAVVDGARGLGNGRLLPAGPLREPAGRLAGVDAVLVHGSGSAPVRARRELHFSLRPGELRAVAGAAREPLAWLQGRQVHAVTGIGHPQRFFALLRGLGAGVIEHALPDHHRFQAADIEFPDPLPVIMTAKDAVKCGSLAGARHWYLPVTVELPVEDERWLLERILALTAAEGSKA